MSSDYPERERYYPETPPKKKVTLPGNYPDSVLRHPSGRGFATPLVQCERGMRAVPN